MTQSFNEDPSNASDAPVIDEHPTPATDEETPATEAHPPPLDLDAFPRWLRQLAQYLPICSQFVVEGNIRDVHLVRSEDGLLMQPVVNCLWELFREQGCEGILIYDRVAGIQVFPSDRQQAIEEKLEGRLHRSGPRGGQRTFAGNPSAETVRGVGLARALLRLRDRLRLTARRERGPLGG